MSELKTSGSHEFVVESSDELEDVVELLNGLQRHFLPEANRIHGGKGFCRRSGLAQTKKLLLAIERAQSKTAQTQAHVQSLRDRVLAMVAEEQPERSIPKYGGKPTDGSPAAFFKKHYASFVVPGQEVIFAPDLGAIDEQLLVALRNECRSDENPMPLGTRTDRTTALILGRFVEGKMAAKAARAAASHRKRAKLHESAVQAH